MGQTSQNRRELADKHYTEIGEALASLVVGAGWLPQKAWGLVSGLALYRRWMLDEWISRYREENPAPEAPRRREKARGRRRALIDSLAPPHEP